MQQEDGEGVTLDDDDVGSVSDLSTKMRFHEGNFM